MKLGGAEPGTAKLGTRKLVSAVARARAKPMFGKRKIAWLVLPLAAGIGLASCSSEGPSMSAQWEETGDKGYVAGDGSTTSFAPEERAEPIEFAGVTEYGEPIGSDDIAGSVSVVNFWYAGCAPCRAEAPDLVEVHEEFDGQGVKFLGVNTRDQSAQAVQFAEEFGIEYPSIMDTEGERRAQRAFAGQVPLNAVPTTLVLDEQGRVAHRVVGQIAAASQLRMLVTETLAEAQG